jgi:TolA-binding protein
MPMSMTGPQGMSGMPPDFNQLDDATKEKIKQFQEKVAKGEISLDPNQMDEQSRERFKQLKNRTRPQSDGQTPSQEP